MSSVDFRTQLASIMEVLAHAAVVEICQLVDDGFAALRLEISRSQRENLSLRSRLRLMEVRSGEQSHAEPPHPLLVVTCPREDYQPEGDRPADAKRKVKPNMLENTQQPRPVNPEGFAIKKERLEELTGCSVLEDHQTAPHSSTGPPSLCFAAQSELPLSVEAGIPSFSASAGYEKEDFSGPEAQQQVEKEEDKDVDPSDSLSVECSGSNVPDVETQLMKTQTGVKGLCGAAADWKEEAVSYAVKVEAELSWSVSRDECLSDSKLTSMDGQHTQSATAGLDTNNLDSSSFDDLFSSPEVARSLTAPHKHSTDGVTSMEEPLSFSCFPFLSSGCSFGNSSMSDPLTASPSTVSDSRSSSFPSSMERGFSCQQCARFFLSSRDLVVHQRSHAGEKIYHCPQCKKPFIHPHQLKTHQRVHTGEKPFSCAQCGKRFSQSSHIKRHMSVHTGEKRHSCSLCGKRFSQACSLKVHQAVHTGEKPHRCTKCGKSFSVLGNLVRHQSVHISK